MRAQVISISSVPRPQRHDWEADAMLCGFSKALAVVHSLNRANMKEIETAFENWVACGKLSDAERAALMEFYGFDGDAQ